MDSGLLIGAIETVELEMIFAGSRIDGTRMSHDSPSGLQNASGPSDKNWATNEERAALLSPDLGKFQVVTGT